MANTDHPRNNEQMKIQEEKRIMMNDENEESLDKGDKGKENQNTKQEPN